MYTCVCLCVCMNVYKIIMMKSNKKLKLTENLFQCFSFSEAFSSASTTPKMFVKVSIFVRLCVRTLIRSLYAYFCPEQTNFLLRANFFRTCSHNITMNHSTIIVTDFSFIEIDDTYIRIWIFYPLRFCIPVHCQFFHTLYVFPSYMTSMLFNLITHLLCE